jgi:cell division protease FtsH
MKKNHQKTLALWIVVILLMAFVIKVLEQNNTNKEKINYSTFIAAVETDRVESVSFQGQNVIRGKYKAGYNKGADFELTGNTGDETFRILREHKIIPNYEREEKQGLLSTILINWFPMILLFVIFYFFLRQIQAGGGKAMSFGKSRAKLLNENEKKIIGKKNSLGT